ncbi:hypothetical protein K933_14748 [Candidatus Halobonum tyrrellensis G22]|uniref:Uncharacterized protein n=1 Tax=Candidatus Halobonum tyrrellensis G22 TaxID=1324957 RepID=V4HHL4_9EURY|nr:hypothetical protein K933_14748 [Candidatus Halobonum tyrrellensis G22]
MLALVPACLACGVGAAWLLSVSTATGVLAGGAAAALVVGYGLFYRAPVDRERGRGHGRERDRARRSDPERASPAGADV